MSNKIKPIIRITKIEKPAIPTVSQLVTQAKALGPLSAKIPLGLTEADVNASSWATVNMLQLTRELLKHGQVVSGDRFALVNTYRTKILGLEPLANSLVQDVRHYQIIILKFMIHSRFWKLGEAAHRFECSNTDDFDTMKNITDIPIAYLFCLKDGTSWYGFDVRTLTTLMSSGSLINPYTQNEFDETVVHRLRLKIRLLESLGFPIKRTESSASNTLTVDDKFKLYVHSVLQKLHFLDYTVNPMWIDELNFHQLKQLYCEVADIWQYRLGETLTQAMRKQIVKGGVIFAEPHIVKTMHSSPQNHRILLTKIIKNLDRLVTEGTTKDNRTLGAIYFMTGLSIVSPKVAEAFPALAHIGIGID